MAIADQLGKLEQVTLQGTLATQSQGLSREQPEKAADGRKKIVGIEEQKGPVLRWLTGLGQLDFRVEKKTLTLLPPSIICSGMTGEGTRILREAMWIVSFSSTSSHPPSSATNSRNRPRKFFRDLRE